MSESIRETVPKVVRTLWDIENELRGAAQNGVILRREEARKHLVEARRHLDELLALVRSDPETHVGDVSNLSPAQEQLKE